MKAILFYIVLGALIIALVIVGIIIAAVGGKRKRLRRQVDRAKIATDSAGVLTFAQIEVWYKKNIKRMNGSTKGLIATKKALSEKNSAITFPVTDKEIIFQSFFNSDDHPIDYRFILCGEVDGKLSEMLEQNGGYIILSDLRKGLK